MKDNVDNEEIKENLLEDNINQKESQDMNLEVNNNNDNKDSMENIDQNENNLNKSFGQVIDDDIKKTDTSEFVSLKKKKTEEVDDEIKNDDNTKTKKEKKTFSIHLKINQKFLRYSTLAIIIIYIIITFASCIIFHNRRKDNPYLFCFKFIERDPSINQDQQEKDIIYFLTDLNSFYILHAVLLFIFFSLIYLLIKGTKSEINEFFRNMSIYFMSALILNIPILINGMLTDFFYGNPLQPSVYLGLTLLSLLCMVRIYLVTKSHKYKTVKSYINISVLSSLMTAYHLYCFFFTASYFIMNFYKPKVDHDNEHPEAEIILSSVYFVIGFAIIFYYKDIFFNIAMVNMEIGLLYTKRKSDYSMLTSMINVGILSLNYASILAFIFKDNKQLFKLEEKKKRKNHIT